MSVKDPLIYVMRIWDCCERILAYTAASGIDWSEEQLVMDAVCRNLEIIGEAARKTEPDFVQPTRKSHGRA